MFELKSGTAMATPAAPMPPPLDVDEVVVEGDEPRSKHRKLTDPDFFERLLSSSKPQEFPGFLRHFQHTDILHIQLVWNVWLGDQRTHF